MKIFILLLILISTNLWSQTINLGRFSIAESRVKIKLEDFTVQYNTSYVRTQWDAKSIQWIRNDNNLLVPRALLKVFIKKPESALYLKYLDKVIYPVKKKQWVESEFYIDLFTPDVITIFEGSSILDKITIQTKDISQTRERALIDYSCSPYDIKVEGLEDEYLSLGCKMGRVGSMGNETPRLEVSMSATNIKAMNNERPPFTIFMGDSSPVKMQVKGQVDKVKTLNLSANLPKRLHRLTTAFGFGPYIYDANEGLNKIKSKLAPSAMLYAKFDLTETASIKAFDALLYSKSLFNNSGLYFSYDLASALDGRIILNALLGFQGLHFKNSKDHPTQFQIIYPQGFEVIYKHAFKENYNLTYGMFLSTDSDPYTNAWIRYGKRSFLELNYIEWGHDKSAIKMWGLSVGLPFINLF